tara:strand:+ start:265 stop:654 length:390 start_codon:yes stop_codon:yes gene_type:complete
MSNKSKFFAELKKHENAKKFGLTTHKIMLSAIDNIRQELDNSYYTDDILNQIDEAETKMIQARDIFRFDVGPAILNAEEELNNLKDKLDELGVDYPAEVQSLESELSEREQVADDIRQRFRDNGYDPMY